jgi:signal peptidase
MQPVTNMSAAEAQGGAVEAPSAARRVGKTLTGVLLAGCVLLAAVMLVPAVFGYQRYVITGGSMTGTIDRGSLAFDKAVPTSELKVGDVITYTPPRSSGHIGRVTHRIVSIGRGANGQRAFQTKGDANAVADPWKFQLSKPTQARVSFHLPYVGFAYAALGIRLVRMLVIGIPALLIAFSIIRSLWRDATEESRRSGSRTDLATSTTTAA